MKTHCRYLISRAIKTGIRKPRANYAHAAKNSAKRDPNAPRGPKYGKVAIRRTQDVRSSSTSSNHDVPARSVTLPSLNQMANRLDPQPGFWPLEPTPFLSGQGMHAPHAVYPPPTEPTVYPQTRLSRGNYSNKPLAGPSGEAAARLSFHRNQDIHHPMFTEYQDRFDSNLDRDLSLFPCTDGPLQHHYDLCCERANGSALPLE